MMDKKIISVILMLIMTLTPTAIFAENEKHDALYDKTVPFLMSLGVIYDGYQEHSMTHYYHNLSAEEQEKIYKGFYPDMKVSRAEFIMFALKLNGVDVESINAVANEQKFTDIPVDHWAAGYINYASSLGLINGIGDQCFAPSEPIKVSQAIKIIVSILGYDMPAEFAGGFPNGYYSLANELGITKGVNISMEDDILKRDMAKLFYNALFVDVLQLTSVSGTVAEQSAIKGENLLYVKFGIRKDKGQVTATKYTSLVGASKLTQNQIEIDKEVYQLEGIDAKDYLGMNVEFYYRDDDGEKTVVYMESNIKDASIVNVKADFILGDDSDFSKNKFVYLTEKNKRRVLTISDNADVIINGRAESEYTKEDFVPLMGDVKLIDSDGNGDFDVIFINRYKNTIVGSIDAERCMIYDKYESERNIEADDDATDYDVIIEKDGVPVKITELKEWDVVSLYESVNTSGDKLKRLSVSSENIDGTIKSIREDIITVSGNEYEISADFRGERGKLKINTEGNFLIDIEGKITAMAGQIQKGGLGYLINAIVDTEDEPTLRMKILTPDGNTVNAVATEKLKINDNRYTNAEDMYKELISSGRYAGYCTQVIRYEINSDDKVNKIYTVKSDDAEEGVALGAIKGSRRYRPGAKTFDGKFVMTADTFVLKMPSLQDENDTSFKEAESYSVLKPESFENYEPYIVEAYNIHDALIADMVLVYSDVAEQQISTKSDIAVVEEKSMRLGADDMPVFCISAWINGSVQEKILSSEIEQFTISVNVADIFSEIIGKNVDSDVSLTDKEDIDKAISLIKRGDVLRFGVNTKNEITRISIDASLSRQGEYFALNQYHHPFRLFYGAVYAYKDNILAISTDVSNYSDAEAYNVSNANVLVYYKKKNKIVKSNAAELSACVYKYNPDVLVFLRSMEGTTKDVVIVKN